MRPRLLCLALLSVLVVAPLATAQEEIEPRIVNGLDTHDFPTTGHLLLGGNPDNASSWCSGTLIGCSTFLTAGHCVCDGVGSQCQPGRPLAEDPSDWTVFLQHGGTYSVAAISVHPSFNFPFADVAVLQLGEAVDGITPTPLNTQQSVPIGTQATIAGFGRSGGSNFDYGLLRYGDVMTSPCTVFGVDPATSVCWRFEPPVGSPGTDSNTCNADSGGPLFVDFGSGQLVAGITSGGTGSNCLPTDRSYDNSVFAWASYIQAQAGGSLGEASCGALPQVGDDDVQVDGFDGSLSVGQPQASHSFEVASGASEVRVTMNSIDDGPSNFDLYVKQGAPPSTGDFDCARNGSGQFGACVFPSPAAGTWHVLVNRASGGGAYQVTATVFGAGAAADPVTIDLASEVTTIAPGDRFPFDINLQTPSGAPSSFGLAVLLVPPGASPRVLIRQPDLQLPPDADITISPTLPLPPGARTGTWRVIGNIFQGGERVSQDVLFFDVE